MKQLLLSPRLQAVLNVVGEKGEATNRKILEVLKEKSGFISRVTIARDLNFLVRNKYLQRKGAGRSVSYISSGSNFLSPINTVAYFLIEPDRRFIKKTKIDFTKKIQWQSLLNQKEIQNIHAQTLFFQKRFEKYNANLINKELERIIIEFSWKSSRIEGNTYSLLDTERLIKESKEAPGKTREETIMILNHKTALAYIWKHAAGFKKIASRDIEEMHSLIVKNLSIGKGVRKRPVGIIGTGYIPHDNIYQIREAMRDLCTLVNSLKEPFVKAIVIASGIAYIQPFEDGNKRTSRLMSNALLLAYKYCPLSYRSIDEVEYKKAVILLYEQHSLWLFKKLYLEQYNFAGGNYFL